MDVILLIIISLAIFFVSDFISKLTKIATPIIYIVIGMVVGFIFARLDVSIIELFPNIKTYNSIVLLLMFFSAGFSLNIKSIKKSGKLTAKLFSLPAYVETFVMTGVIYITVKLFSGALGVELSIFESACIAGILAVASPANIVPICLNLIKEGFTGKNNVPGTMIAVSVVDGFITLPVIAIGILISLASATGKINMNGLTALLIIIGVVIGAILICLFGVIVGRIILILVTPLLNKIKEGSGKVLPIIVLLITFSISTLVITGLGMIPTIGMLLSTFGILIACVIGATITYYDKTKGTKSLGMIGNIIFALIGMPIVFTYVGARMDLSVLFTPVTLIVCIIITVVSFITKGFTTLKLLKKNSNFTDGERKFAATCFIPKGVTLINMAVVFTPLVSSANMTYLTDFMVMLAAITIIITMTIGVTILNGAKGKWILNKNSVEEENSLSM